jgi:hypothetical protein
VGSWYVPLFIPATLNFAFIWLLTLLCDQSKNLTEITVKPTTIFARKLSCHTRFSFALKRVFFVFILLSKVGVTADSALRAVGRFVDSCRYQRCSGQALEQFKHREGSHTQSIIDRVNNNH